LPLHNQTQILALKQSQTMNKLITLKNKASVAISAVAAFGLFTGFVPALNLNKPATSLWFSPLI